MYPSPKKRQVYKYPFVTQKRKPQGGVFHKAGWYLPRNKRSTSNFVRTPFHTPCSARYIVLHLLGVLSGGSKPPLCKGSLFMFTYVLSIFLTSTAFVDTKAKPRAYGKSDYNVINALKSSVSLIVSKQRLLFKQRMKSSTSVISESVTGCSSSISENSGEVNFIVFW